MPIDRFFIEGEITEGQTLFLEGEEMHHITKVTRHELGEEIELVNGKNLLATALIEKIGKKHIEIRVQKAEVFPAKKPKIILGQIIPKWNRLDTIIEKGTELGVEEFWLIPSLNAKKESFTDSQKERLKNICISSLKQCGRLSLPSIHFPGNLLTISPSSGSCFFGDVRKDAPLFWNVCKESSLQGPFFFFVGPEGGFHTEEIEVLEKNWKAQGVCFSENILRTDTASITALALLQHALQCRG